MVSPKNQSFSWAEKLEFYFTRKTGFINGNPKPRSYSVDPHSPVGVHICDLLFPSITSSYLKIIWCFKKKIQSYSMIKKKTILKM